MEATGVMSVYCSTAVFRCFDLLHTCTGVVGGAVVLPPHLQLLQVEGDECEFVVLRQDVLLCKGINLKAHAPLPHGSSQPRPLNWVSSLGWVRTTLGLRCRHVFGASPVRQLVDVNVHRRCSTYPAESFVTYTPCSSQMVLQHGRRRHHREDQPRGHL